ncbi:MAG: AAA family ATPase [Nitrospira sp.]|jgi:succinoglycan biosynthesis transport protein ExoP|nr:AAA family ATPase [Nitrospira sp.]
MNIQALTPEDLLRVSLKRKWWILASVVVCIALAYVVWMYFPRVFKSTAILTVDSPRIAKEYVKGVSPDGKAYEDPAVAVMQQVSIGLTSKTILMPVLETLKPYPEAERASPDQLMKRLRKAVTIGRPKDGVGVSISYVHSDPRMAQEVLALLCLKLQEDNLKRRENLVETTTEFLSAELERVKGDLEAKERAISDFKRAHMGELPQQMDANLRTLDRLQVNLVSTSDSLNKLGERLTALEKAIKEFSDLGQAGIVSERPQRVGDIRPIDSRVAKLRDLKQKLNELLGVYKENYPDIVYLKQEISRLESVMSDEPGQASVDGEAGKLDGNYGNSSKPVDPYLRELMKERSEVKSEIAFLKEKQALAVRQIKELESRVERAPIREQSLAELLRDYENMQKGYQSLLDKRTNARIVENYESRQFGEQYRIIEAPNFPYTQEPPTLLHFLLGGFALGCLIGFGSAIGLECLKTGFRRPEEVESLLGFPVIASIPAFSTVMSGLGVKRAQALLAGPAMSTSATVSVPSYLGYRNEEDREGQGRKKEPANSGGSLPPTFHLVAKWGAASLMAEQYRVAATRLILMTVEKQNVVTLVTSSVMSEGKTTTAANLAYILAHDLGKSTLLIDCDFKRPMVHEYMGIPAAPGVGDVLQGGELLENCIHQCDGVPLWILPSGSSGVRPVGLSGIQYVKSILPEVKRRYDYVILDGPPVMPLADVNVLGGMADMTAFVVRAGTTNQDIVKKALKVLGDKTETVIVLTQIEMEHAPYFMYAAAYANEDSGIRA